MDEEQEERNQSQSFTKQQMKKGKDKLKEEGKKQAKKKIVQFLAANPEVVAILAIVIVVVIIVVVLVCGAVYVVDKWQENDVNKSKQKAMEVSYGGNTSTTTTDDNGNTVNKIVVQPNNKKDGYEISYNNDPENLDNIKKKLETQTSRSAAEFSDFELAVLGALMDNGASLDYYTAEQLHCFPAFIRAEAATQFLDLRKNSEKFKNGIYTPMQLSDFSGKNNNQVSGVILVQRTNTNGNVPSTLEYMQEADFNKLVEANDEKARNYFTVNNKGNLVIAKWDMQEIEVKGEYPENLPDTEKEQSTGQVYIITTEEIAYSEYIKKYTMPFEFLVQLLVVTQETDFCTELVDYIMGSKIVINIQEEETYTHTIEERTYTVHSKDEKRIDYKIASVVEIESNENYLLRDKQDDKGQPCTNYEVNDKKVTIDRKYTSHSYSFEVTEADTWLAHYTKDYAILSGEQEPEYKDTVTDIPDDYSEVPGSETITDSNETVKDKDVKKFKNDLEKYYKDFITIPEVKLKFGTKNLYVVDPITSEEKWKEIPGNDEITITPKDKIASTSLRKYYI